MKVSGETMLYIVSRVLFLIERNPWELPEQFEVTPEETPEDEQ